MPNDAVRAAQHSHQELQWLVLLNLSSTHLNVLVRIKQSQNLSFYAIQSIRQVTCSHVG